MSTAIRQSQDQTKVEIAPGTSKLKSQHQQRGAWVQERPPEAQQCHVCVERPAVQQQQTETHVFSISGLS